MLGGRLLSAGLATFVGAQIGNANDAITPPRQQGAIAGDYAIWINTGAPSSGWTQLGSAHGLIYGKQLTASDLNLSARPSQSWGLAIYRDVTSAAARSPGGFAKSPAHMGAVGVFSAASGGAPSQIATPPGAATRFYSNTATYFALFDVVAPRDAYPDGAPFGNGSDDYWAAFELLRS